MFQCLATPASPEIKVISAVGKQGVARDGALASVLIAVQQLDGQRSLVANSLDTSAKVGSARSRKAPCQKNTSPAGT